jgi:hypothetical protein
MQILNSFKVQAILQSHSPIRLLVVYVYHPTSLNRTTRRPFPFSFFTAKNAYMKKLFYFAAGCFLVFSCNNKHGSFGNGDRTANSTDTTYQDTRPCEFADAKYTDLGKAAMSKFQSGDIDGWLTYYADSTVIRQSPADSLYGKAAIAKLWKERRKMETGSIQIKNDIWLPLKVNRPQKGDDLEDGIWLLNWHHVNLEYKNEKRQKFWVHTDFHFDKNDKIDIMLEYFDASPIVAALKK